MERRGLAALPRYAYLGVRCLLWGVGGELPGNQMSRLAG